MLIPALGVRRGKACLKFVDGNARVVHLDIANHHAREEANALVPLGVLDALNDIVRVPADVRRPAQRAHDAVHIEAVPLVFMPAVQRREQDAVQVFLPPVVDLLDGFVHAPPSLRAWNGLARAVLWFFFFLFRVRHSVKFRNRKH